ncbi:uracil-DNA glycosylase [Eubacteriales bacterium OttesenSCG-928-N13]|nr:uracil-DNA glycosylase [Eubacteriales bacterium OttesenSCG-928-N13]
MMKKFKQEMTRFFRELYQGEQKVLVFGEGEEHAAIMLIGEAPGEQESLSGRPFVGKAGRNLDEFLALSGFDRAQLYITNTVKFRPVRTSDAGRTVNRTPSREEIELFLPWLRREIALVKPECVVTLGNTALRALMGNKVTIGAVHGRFQMIDGQLIYPMYHPASVIYNRALRDTYLEDIRRLADWRENRKQHA